MLLFFFFNFFYYKNKLYLKLLPDVLKSTNLFILKRNAITDIAYCEHIGME